MMVMTRSLKSSGNPSTSVLTWLLSGCLAASLHLRPAAAPCHQRDRHLWLSLLASSESQWGNWQWRLQVTEVNLPIQSIHPPPALQASRYTIYLCISAQTPWASPWLPHYLYTHVYLRASLCLACTPMPLCVLFPSLILPLTPPSWPSNLPRNLGHILEPSLSLASPPSHFHASPCIFVHPSQALCNPAHSPWCLPTCLAVPPISSQASLHLTLILTPTPLPLPHPHSHCASLLITSNNLSCPPTSTTGSSHLLPASLIASYLELATSCSFPH